MNAIQPPRFGWLIVGFAIAVGVTALVWDWPESREASAKPLALVVSGDTAGWIMPCGCTANQSGGLLRRATYLKQLSEEMDVLFVDAGGAASGTSPYFRTKFEAILRGELAMNVEAHNIGGSEAALGGEYLRWLAKEMRVPFVSANIRDASGVPIAESVRIIERGGLKIGVTGVLSKRYASPQCVVEDPREAVLKIATQIKGRADRLVVLAYMPEEELRLFAAAVPEASAVVGGPTGQSIAPQTVGSTTLGSATNKGKFLIRLNVLPEQRWTGEVIELTPSFADDSEQQANVRRYLDDLSVKDFTAADTGVTPPLPGKLPADYRIAGSSSCQRCHGQDCSSWAGSKHAHAWQTLTERGYHVDSYCQHCHTTGFGLPGGFESATKAGQLHSVGCESCHGPSHAHAKNPKVRTMFAAKDQCATCHDRENSPTFQYDTFWPKMRHGEPAMPPKGASQ
jgi:Cytochrome c554 and c-prime